MVLSTHAPDNRASSYARRGVTELLVETDEPATTAGTPVPGSEDRPSTQEIRKDTMELNATIRQWDRSHRPSHRAAAG